MSPDAQELQNVVNGLASEFACGGTLELESNVVVTLTQSAGGTKNCAIKPGTGSGYESSWNKQKSWMANQEALLKPLIDTAPQAAFGHGNQTKTDKTVRDALQLKAADFEVNLGDDELEKIRKEVQRKLVPDDPNPITLEKYSLNIYRKGGHFHGHRDTPRGDDMIGTLLILLPTRFSTGYNTTATLSVKANGFEREYFRGESSYSSNGNRNAKTIEYAAFFGDCQHQVNPISKGHRITVAYIVRRGANPADKAEEYTLGQRAAVFKKKVMEGLEDPEWYPEGKKLAFCCFQMYTNQQIWPKGSDSDDALTAKGLKALKGKDGVVAAAADQLGLDVYLKPIMRETCCEEEFICQKIPTKKNIRKRVTPDSIPGESLEHNPELLDVEWVVSDPGVRKASRTKQNPNPNQPMIMYLKDSEYSATGYFGNEASHTSFYLFCALLIDIPSTEDRTELLKKIKNGTLKPKLKAKKSSKKKASAKKASKKKASAKKNKKRPRQDSDEEYKEHATPPKKKTKKNAADSDDDWAVRFDRQEKAAKKRKPTKAELLNCWRTINVSGAQGATTKVGDGTGSFQLGPGQGLKELKQMCRRKFGKARYKKLGQFTMENTGTKVQSKDLLAGVNVVAHYSAASGNAGNLFGRRRRRTFMSWF